jgi:hypothetical protein
MAQASAINHCQKPKAYLEQSEPEQMQGPKAEDAFLWPSLSISGRDWYSRRVPAQVERLKRRVLNTLRRADLAKQGHIDGGHRGQQAAHAV